MLGASKQASADSVCGNVNATGNATFPGLYVGTVSSTCVLGALPNTQGITDNAALDGNHQVSIYEFYFGGGSLNVTELLGNQGTGTAVDLELDSLASMSSTSASVLQSTPVPYQSNAGATASVSATNLAPGYYAVDTYFATANTTDPQYEITINATPGVPTPEPGSVVLLGAGLLSLAFFARRRSASQGMAL
jgi:hypothetical protein